jgi:glycosyltransferase EpsJ
MEIILVDDGSPDGCPRILDDFAKEDPRVVVIHKKNGGDIDARNAGIRIAKGTYLGFVDADDYLEPDMFESMVSSAEKFDVDIVACGAWYELKDGGTKLLHTSFPKDKVLDHSAIRPLIESMVDYGRDFWFPWRNIYRRSFFDSIGGEFDVSVKYGFDTNFNMIAYFHAKGVYVLDRPLYHYVQNPNSIIQSKRKEKYLEHLTHTYESRKKICVTLGLDPVKFTPWLKATAIEKYLPDAVTMAVSMSGHSLKDELRRIRNSPMIEEAFEGHRLASSLTNGAKAIIWLIQLRAYWLLALYLRMRDVGFRTME